MLQKINVPYGYNTFQVHTVLVFTAKIRIATDYETVMQFINDPMVQVYNGKGNTIIIAWSTTDGVMHNKLIGNMNSLLAHVMHKRIAYKYGELVTSDAVELDW